MMNYRYARNEAKGENGISNKNQLSLDSFCKHCLVWKRKTCFKAFWAFDVSIVLKFAKTAHSKIFTCVQN